MSEPQGARRPPEDEEGKPGPARRHFLILEEQPLNLAGIEAVESSRFARALSRLAAHWPQVERWRRPACAGSSDSLSATEEADD